jgi:hypothetical protein
VRLLNLFLSLHCGCWAATVINPGAWLLPPVCEGCLLACEARWLLPSMCVAIWANIC